MVQTRKHATKLNWRFPNGSARHGRPGLGALCAGRQSRRSTFRESQPVVQLDSHWSGHGHWCFAARVDSRNVHFGLGRTFGSPSLVPSVFHFLCLELVWNRKFSLQGFRHQTRISIKTKMDIETTLEYWTELAQPDFGTSQLEFYSVIYFFLHTLPSVKTQRTRGVDYAKMSSREFTAFQVCCYFVCCKFSSRFDFLIIN